MSLTLRVVALKIVNRGGGSMHRIDRKKQQMLTKTDRGTDYVVFVCPSCDMRQKHSMYAMEAYKPANEDCVPFKCTRCRNIIEVQRPITHAAKALIITPEEFTAQRRGDATVNRSIVGRS